MACMRASSSTPSTAAATQAKAEGQGQAQSRSGSLRRRLMGLAPSHHLPSPAKVALPSSSAASTSHQGMMSMDADKDTKVRSGSVRRTRDTNATLSVEYDYSVQPTNDGASSEVTSISRDSPSRRIDPSAPSHRRSSTPVTASIEAWQIEQQQQRDRKPLTVRQRSLRQLESRLALQRASRDRLDVPRSQGVATMPSLLDVERQDTQSPRLSMSSAESNSGSEAKTPDSIHAAPLWSPTDVMGKVQSDQHTLDDDGNGSVSMPLPAMAAPPASRSSTVRLRRPDGLLKMPRGSFQTDCGTMTPNTPLPMAATKPPLDDAIDTTALDMVTDTMRTTSDSNVGPLDLSRSTSNSSQATSSEEEHRLDGSSVGGKVGRSSSVASSVPPRMVASPDSWRSLLPEDDPYYISADQLSRRASSSVMAMSDRAPNHAMALDAALSNALHHRPSLQLGLAAVGREDPGRRWSNGGRTVATTLAAPLARSAIGGGGSSHGATSLYDLDGSFNEGGSRTAFAPLQYSYNRASRSLTSPTTASASPLPMVDPHADWPSTTSSHSIAVAGMASTKALEDAMEAMCFNGIYTVEEARIAAATTTTATATTLVMPTGL